MLELLSISLSVVFLILAISCVVGLVKLLSRDSSEFSIVADSGFNIVNFIKASIKKPNRISTPMITEGMKAKVEDGKFVASPTRTISSDII